MAMSSQVDARQTRRTDIQGLRAIAVLVVVCFHAGLPIPGGFVGVDVFFVISGYVITSMLQREWSRTGKLHFRRFYARRFKRLIPALALMVSTVLIFSAVIQSPLGAQQSTAKTALGAMLFSANFVLHSTTGGYFDAAAEDNPLLNTWSLSVEEQFYLFFPMVLFLCWRVARTHRRVGRLPLVIVVLIAACSFSLMLGTSRGGSLPFVPEALVGFYGPLGRVWEFSAGAVLALVISGPTSGRSGIGSKGAWTVGLVGSIMVLASLFVINETTGGPGIRNLLPVVGAVLVLLAGSGASNPTSRLLGTRPFVLLGDLSYSWYLWHWPFIVFAVLLWPGEPLVPISVALISLVPSVASYRLVEQPIRRAGSMTRAKWARLFTLTLLPPVCLSLLILFAASNGYWLETIAKYQQGRRFHEDMTSKCWGSMPDLRYLSWGNCTWNPEARGDPIYLLGDSNAGHFSEAVIGVGQALGRPVTIYTVHGCPFMDVSDYVDLKATSDPCPSYVGRTLEWLAQQPPGLVILSSTSSPNTPPQYYVGDSEPWSTNHASEEYLRSILTKTVQELQSDGNAVLMVQPVPHFSKAPYELAYDRCSLLHIVRSTCNQEVPVDFIDRAQGNLRSSISATAAMTGSSTLDLRSYFCPDRICVTQRNGLILYADEQHISVDTSRDLEGQFEKAVVQTQR